MSSAQWAVLNRWPCLFYYWGDCSTSISFSWSSALLWVKLQYRTRKKDLGSVILTISRKENYLQSLVWLMILCVLCIYSSYTADAYCLCLIWHRNSESPMLSVKLQDKATKNLKTFGPLIYGIIHFVALLKLCQIIASFTKRLSGENL